MRLIIKVILLCTSFHFGTAVAAQEAWDFVDGTFTINVESFTPEDHAALAVHFGVSADEVKKWVHVEVGDNPFSDDWDQRYQSLVQRGREWIGSTSLQEVVLFYDYIPTVVYNFDPNRISMSVCLGGTVWHNAGSIRGQPNAPTRAVEMALPGSSGKILRGPKCGGRLLNPAYGKVILNEVLGHHFSSILDVKFPDRETASRMFDAADGFQKVEVAGVCGLERISAGSGGRPKLDCMHVKIRMRHAVTKEELLFLDIPRGAPGDIKFSFGN